jgi:PKD repeat protein
VNIERYDWDFGDGSPTLTTTGNSTSKTYTVAKTYKVKVTVHASDGSTGVAALDLVVT